MLENESVVLKRLNEYIGYFNNGELLSVGVSGEDVKALCDLYYGKEYLTLSRMLNSWVTLEIGLQHDKLTMYSKVIALSSCSEELRALINELSVLVEQGAWGGLVIKSIDALIDSENDKALYVVERDKAVTEIASDKLDVVISARQLRTDVNTFLSFIGSEEYRYSDKVNLGGRFVEWSILLERDKYTYTLYGAEYKKPYLSMTDEEVKGIYARLMTVINVRLMFIGLEVCVKGCSETV